MKMNVSGILAAWTHCYHVTYEVNLPAIREARSLSSANRLFSAAHADHLRHHRRSEDVAIQVGRHPVLVRNQCALDPASLDLGIEGRLEQYIAALNSHAYFWPGTIAGPVSDGVRMVERSNGTPFTIIRMCTGALLDANDTSTLVVSTCNSGAAWTDEGRKSRRGPDVFRRLDRLARPAGEVVEICFAGFARLPESATYANGLGGPWRRLFSS